MSPAFYSEGATIEAGWLVPAEPVTVYWSGTVCGSGVPYIRVGGSRITVLNQLYWAPDSPLYFYKLDSTAIQDNILIKAVQSPTTGACSYPGSGGMYYDDMMELDMTPVDAHSLGFPWTLVPADTL